MIKKIISVFLIVLIIASLGSTAFAASEEDGREFGIEKRIEAIERRQQRLEERRERRETRYSLWQHLIENSELRHNNRMAVLDAASETVRLRLDLLNILKSMRDSGVQPSEEVKSQLREYKNQIVELRDSLKQSRDQTRDIRAELRGSIKNNDLEVLEAALEQIASVQEQRIKLVEQINAFLQKMIELVEQE